MVRRIKLCECGCGKFAKLGNRFINGHNGRLFRHTKEAKRKIADENG